MSSNDYHVPNPFRDIGMFVTRNINQNDSPTFGEHPHAGLGTSEPRFQSGFGDDYEERARQDRERFRNDNFDVHRDAFVAQASARPVPPPRLQPNRGYRVAALPEEEYPRLGDSFNHQQQPYRHGRVVRAPDPDIVPSPHSTTRSLIPGATPVIDPWAIVVPVNDNGQPADEDPQEVWLRTQRRQNDPVNKVLTDSIRPCGIRRKCGLNGLWTAQAAINIKNDIIKQSSPPESDNDAASNKGPSHKVWMLNEDEVVDECSDLPRSVNLQAIYEKKEVREAVLLRDDLDIIPIGPSVAAAIESRLTEETETPGHDHSIGLFGRLSTASTSTDPLSRVQLSLPDKFNFGRERKEIVQKYVAGTLNELYSKQIFLASKNSNFALQVGAGGTSSICWVDRGDDCSVLLSTSCPKEEVEKRYGSEYPGLVEVIPLNFNDHKMWYERYHFALPQQSCRVMFSSAEQARAMIDQERARAHGDEHLQRVREFPGFLLWQNGPSTSGEKSAGQHLMRETETSVELHMDIRWYTSPSRKSGCLLIRDPSLVAFCENVLVQHGMPVDHNYDRKPNDNKIELKWSYRCSQKEAHDDKYLNKLVSEILDANEIEMSKLFLYRNYQQNVKADSVRLTNQIHRRLVCAAINAEIWTEEQPTDTRMWEKLYENASRLPWTVEISQKEKEDAHEGLATVKFRDLEMGKVIVDYLEQKTPDPDNFTLNKSDTLGARVSPKYRQTIAVPMAVRVACDLSIRDFDSVLHANAIDEQWARLLEPSSSMDVLAVEGFPREYVSDCATRLLSLFDGNVIDCSNLDMEGRLLYGYGAQWVSTIRAQMAPRLIVINDVILQEIRLIGDNSVITEAERLMRLYVERRDRFAVDTSIVIRPPRYLDVMRELIDYLTIPHLRAVMGGGKMRANRKTFEIAVKGSVSQMEALHEYLDGIDSDMSAACQLPPSRPQCPVCLCPVLSYNYCLDGCGHYYCMPCLASQVDTGIRTRNLPLNCLFEACDRPIVISDIQKLLFGDPAYHYLPSWFFSDRLNLFMRSSLDCVLRSAKNMQACSSPDCFGVFQTNEVDSDTTTITCSTCSRPKCAKCAYEPHPDFDCEQYARIRDDVEASLNAYRVAAKVTINYCPNQACKAAIERTVGCNHMQCSFCKIHFCWLCGTQAETQSEIYKHMSDSNCGTGGGWVIENGRLLVAPEEAGVAADPAFDELLEQDAQLAMAIHLAEQRLDAPFGVLQPPPGFDNFDLNPDW